MTFENLGLSADLLDTVAREGYVEATPVQIAAIPLVLAGRDVLAAAQTGTGKTAAFALPILERLRRTANTAASPARHPVRALVLTPTRELAVQVEESFRTYGPSLPLRSAVVYGGMPMDPQTRALWSGVEILVATPGRLLDHLGQGRPNLGQVEVLVLDEADRMLDMGFIPDVRRIVSMLPRQRQTLFFSATFSEDIRRLAREFLRDPATVEVAPRNTIAANVAQVLYPVDAAYKSELLAHLVRRDGMSQVLVFTRTKSGASRLASYLDRHGIDAVAIHGDRSQQERTRALEDFKRGEVQILVATDVASRGLDIEELPYVVNYELPWEPQDYVHRIGRTGRAGASGVAISLVTPDEVEQLRGVQRMLKRAIPVQVVEEYLPGGPAPAERPARAETRAGSGDGARSETRGTGRRPIRDAQRTPSRAHRSEEPVAG
ncbi:MAG: DEAD/DEAH box helicase [Chloroflexi bacterium]|nr:DEAD/DEAH box helicase [Chloroflexota bacterium]